MTFPISDYESDYVNDLKKNLSDKFLIHEPKNFFILSFTINQIIYRPTVMHFDWFHMYYSNKDSFFKTVIKFFFFIVDVLILRIFQKNIYISLHNIKPHDSKYRTIDYIAFRLFLNSAKSIRAFSNYSKKVISRFYKIKEEKINVYYESIYSSERSASNKISQKNTDKKKILVFGQIRRYKNIFETLMKIKDSIIKNNIHVVILGNAYDKKYFEKLTIEINDNFKDRVKIINKFVNKEEISSIFQEFDFVLNTSEKFYNSGVLSHCIPLKIPFITKRSFGIEERMKNNIHFTYQSISNNFLDKVIEYKFDDLYHNDFLQTKEFIEKIYNEIK